MTGVQTCALPTVNSSCCYYKSFSRYSFSSRSEYHVVINTVLNIRVTRFSNSGYSSVFNTYISFYYSCIVSDENKFHSDGIHEKSTPTGISNREKMPRHLRRGISIKSACSSWSIQHFRTALLQHFQFIARPDDRCFGQFVPLPQIGGRDAETSGNAPQAVPLPDLRGRILDTAGRVEKFKRRYERHQH